MVRNHLKLELQLQEQFYKRFIIINYSDFDGKIIDLIWEK